MKIKYGKSSSTEQLQISYSGKNGGLVVGSDVHVKISESFTRGFRLCIRKKTIIGNCSL